MLLDVQGPALGYTLNKSSKIISMKLGNIQNF